MNIAAYQIVEALLDFDPRRPARPGNLQEDHMAEPKDVIYQDKVVPDGTIICPHCNREIGEKETFSDDDLATTRHRPCNGIIKFRPPDDEVLKHIERAWGVRFDKATNKWSAIERPGAAKSDEDSNGEPDDYDEYA
jgi:hypothetical protein